MAEKVRYKVDLRHYMADCDVNYHRLLRLFPGLKRGGERVLGIDQQDDSQVVLTVLENTPYTTLMQLVQRAEDATKWIANPKLVVRLYHDAKTAEVINNGGRARALPRYRYPNNRMYQQDEKAQWNRFLGEWLNYCQKFGHIAEPVYP